jgi:hypothetical protein
MTDRVRTTWGLRTGFARLAELPTFVAEAPSSIKAAVTTIAQEDRFLYNDLAAAGFDYTKPGPGAVATTEAPKFVAADTRVANYMSRGCGLSGTT